jgi:RNA 2',3'-cyclic 3'-phosphodiesterase
MRAFIALELPAEVQSYLAAVQKILRESGCGISWVKPPQIHLTLKFLGEISEESSLRMQKELESIALATPSYTLSLGAPGAFPSIAKPKVIWMGIERGAAETERLAGSIEEMTQREGIPKEERPFTSHLTLGRIRTPERLFRITQILEKMREEPLPHEVTWPAGPLALFKSTLTPQGPLYTPLKEVSLTTT